MNVRFNLRERISVTPPYRLDLTVDALRRLASNVVDVVENGAYYRALGDDSGSSLLEVTQVDARSLEIRGTGTNAARFVSTISKMLGVHADTTQWRARAAKIAWLKPIAHALEGLRPVRYSYLWEACAHAVVFQQISIHAAGAIMRRMVEALGEPVEAGGIRAVVFPTPGQLLAARPAQLVAAGLSRNKQQHLRSIAEAIAGGELLESEIEALATPAAAERLVRTRGIGPWSAAVVLLRGFGRLDTFPMRDSGVARSVRLLSGDENVDLDQVLDVLGATRGMLYYHLLLGRLRNLGPGSTD